MESWQASDAIDNMLRHISKTYKGKSTAVTQWAAKLAENRIWRGSNTSKVRVRAPKKKGGPRRKPKCAKSKRASTTPPVPKKVWTTEQREEATKKKGEEADKAALEGVRRSRRARVPTEKALNGK